MLISGSLLLSHVMLSSWRGSKDFNYLQLESDSVLQHSKATLFKDMETDWAALTMSTHAKENFTRMTMVHIPHLGNIIAVGVRVGPIARSGDRHYFMGRTSRPLDLPRAGCFFGLFFLGREPDLWRGKLPQPDLWVCSPQLPLYRHKCAWMLDEHGVKIDKNFLLKGGVLFCDVVA